MRRLALLLLALLTCTQTAAFASGSDWGTGDGASFTTGNGVGWFYSARDRAFYRVPTEFESPRDAPKLEWAHTPTCDGNLPEGADSALCSAAFCFTSEGTPGIDFWVYSRRVDQQDATWELVGNTCIAGEERVEVADVERELERIVEREFQRVAKPTISLAPATVALVNLPVIAWTEDLDPIEVDIDQPLPGRIDASPTYRWAWSSGSDASGAGRPYDPSVSPLETPDYYVHGLRTTPGPLSVTLTVTWDGAVTVPGLPPVPIDPLVYEATSSIDVSEARSELVDPKR